MYGLGPESTAKNYSHAFGIPSANPIKPRGTDDPKHVYWSFDIGVRHKASVSGVGLVALGLERTVELRSFHDQRPPSWPSPKIPQEPLNLQPSSSEIVPALLRDAGSKHRALETLSRKPLSVMTSILNPCTKSLTLAGGPSEHREPMAGTSTSA